MPIQHTVVFNLNHDHDSAEEAAFLDTGRATLSRIPGVEQFTINRQVSAKSAMRWQFSMNFVDQAAYDAYNAHPAHVQFVEQNWKSEVVDFQEFDFVAA